MILRVNPNRMELLRLKKRLGLAKRGHKLLQGKLEEMMRRFLVLIKDFNSINDEFQKKTKIIYDSLIYCRITSAKDVFLESLSRIESEINLDISSQRIMNVKVPVFNVVKIGIEKKYDYFKASAQLDVAMDHAKDYIAILCKLASSLKTLEILSIEIERTRRRVNALEYTLIPSIEATIRNISQKLNEIERGNLVRLMRVKEIVRSH
ncbi:MAG: V-type ATP synthase subunit D [Candidatus Gygaella obscura]|nr:V-type ATP synthase subunit D [Candidatus Gygaella obscura]